jgi:hypothetical protein
MIALMGMVCGADNAEELEDWGAINEQWLSGLLPLPHGTPTQDVFLAVFAAIDPAGFLCANVAETPASPEFSVEGGEAIPHGQGREEIEVPVARCKVNEHYLRSQHALRPRGN